VRRSLAPCGPLCRTTIAVAGAVLLAGAVASHDATALTAAAYQTRTRPSGISSTRDRRHHYSFYRFTRSKRSPPPPKGFVLPSGTVPVTSTGTPTKQTFVGPDDEASCHGYVRLPKDTVLLGFVEWSTEPRLKMLYSARHLPMSCRRGVELTRRLERVQLRVGQRIALGSWACTLRNYVTADNGYVPELRIVCSTPRYSFTTWPVNVIVLQAETSGSNYPPPGAMYLGGDAVALKPQRGLGWVRQPRLDAMYADLDAFYVVGTHKCGQSAASTEAAMARSDGLVEAGEGIEPPGLDYPIEELSAGTYWACLYFQRSGSEGRAVTLMESYVPVA